MPTTVIQYFAFAHLSAPNLRSVSAACSAVANSMETHLPDGPEKSAGMRKLLEAKDCFVRAALAMPKEQEAPPVTFQPPPVGTEHLAPHQQRVVAEANELRDKLTKLNAFITGKSQTWDNLPFAEQDDMSLQAVQMQAYLDTLDSRIERFTQAGA